MMTLEQSKLAEKLEQGLGAIAGKYFYNGEYGYEKARVTYFEYDIRKWTFRYNSQTLNYGCRMYLKCDKDLNEFRKEVRSLLKEAGFTSVKFDFRNVKYQINYWNGVVVENRKELVGIYFDK